MDDDTKKLGLKALLEKGEIAQFFDVQMKEKDGQVKGQLIGTIARIGDMVTQHAEGVFVEEITKRLTQSIVKVAEEISNGLSQDLEGTETSLRQLVAETDEQSRQEILTELSDKLASAESNLQSAITAQIRSALPELAESARLTEDEKQELVDFASLSVESQMSDLIGSYFADNALEISEIEGFKDAVEGMIKNIEIPKDNVDFKRITNLPEALDKFLQSGGKTQIKYMGDVKNWDDFQDGYALVWDDTDKKLKPAAVDSLPTQTGNNGKYLTTDGTTASWATLAGGGDMAAATYDPNTVSGDAFLMTNMNGGNWKVFYSNGTGDVTELTLGASGTVLQSNGATSAPTWETVSATVSAINDIGDVTITTLGADELLFTQDGSTWVNQTLTEAGIQGILTEGAFVDGDKTKLDGIEASADVTDTANVTAAGALMDSEVTNLAAVKAFDPTDYATAAQGATADSALQNVVDDTTPQLGGSLDVNGNKIVSTANGNIDIEPNGTGNVLLGNLSFDADQTVGVGQDNYVLTYDHSTGLISLEVATGGGIASLLEDTSPQLGGDLDANGNNIALDDINQLRFGADADLTIEHTGTNNLISGDTGNIIIDNTAVTGKIQNQLGTDTSATGFEVLNNTGTVLFSVDGDGAITLGAATTGVLRADSGVISTDSDVTDIVAAASTSAAGKVELATTAETNTGTDTGRAVTPDGLAGSNFGIRYVQVTCFDYATATATGDGKGYFHIPAGMNGMNLVEVHAEVITAGTTGTTDIQIANVTQAADMLTTKITIDSTETGSDTAATAAVIDTANDDVATNDLIRIDVDAVSTTPAQGLIVTLGFQLP